MSFHNKNIIDPIIIDENFEIIDASYRYIITMMLRKEKNEGRAIKTPQHKRDRGR